MTVWSDRGRAGRFDTAGRGGRGPAIERLKERTRHRFALSQADAVVITEEKPTFPGAPPVSTVVAFWTGDGRPHHFRVFKAAHEVVESDIPPAWLRDSLAGVPGITCSCC